MTDGPYRVTARKPLGDHSKIELLEIIHRGESEMADRITALERKLPQTIGEVLIDMAGHMRRIADCIPASMVLPRPLFYAVYSEAARYASWQEQQMADGKNMTIHTSGGPILIQKEES